MIFAPATTFAAYGLTQSPTTATTGPKYFSVAGGATLAITNNITVEGWFKFSDPVNTSFDVGPVGKWGVPANAAWTTEIFWDGTKFVETFNVVNGTTVSSATVTWATPVQNTWYHLAWTFSSGSVNFYINGVQNGTTQTVAATSFNAVSGTVTNIGAASSINSATNGQESLVRIWNVARTQAQIQANMCNVFGTATTNMLAEWSLNNVLTDASGNALTLTNNGAVPFITDTPAACVTVIPFNFGRFFDF